MVTSNIYIVLSLSLAFFLVLPTKANLTDIVSFTFNDFSKGKPNLILQDGLAFFLALVGSQPQSNREYLSLFSNTTISVQTMAVEFDTFSKKKWHPTESHIGIDVNLI
ncbi:hypothetical protein JHK87_027662 [Glycine soja]|nr:hypothetical protein JHK87_027662 [Glycine soja]